MQTKKDIQDNIFINAKEIESPISVFNNIQIQVSNIFSEVFYPGMNKNVNQLLAKNELLFIDKSILIMNKFRLQTGPDNFMEIKILCNPKAKELEYLSLIHENYEKVTAAYNQYVIMYNRVCENYNDVPHELISSIIKGIHSNDDSVLNKYYLLQVKEKFNRYMLANNDYTDDDKNLLQNLYGRYDFCIKFSIVNGGIKYKIYKLLSSLLNENNSLENLRFEDIEVIKSEIVQLKRINEFVYKLFNYSEII